MKWPLADGTSSQVLSTDGAGNLAWATASGGGGGGSGATLSAVAGSTTYYVGMSATSSGAWSDARVDTTNLYYSSGSQTLFATNYNTSSDETVKTNIHTIEDALAIIMLLRGVGFDWLATGLKSYGVIAQELEKHIPDLVTTINGKKTVNYNAIIGFLIEAIKSQTTSIKMLEARVDVLENKDVIQN
jgi:outer membrane protein assembly factor BamB